VSIHRVPLRDPICGRALRLGSAHLQESYKGRVYVLCSEACRELFHRRAERLRWSDRARAGTLLTPTQLVRWGQA